MIYKFTGIDVDDMIFESSEEIVSERWVEKGWNHAKKRGFFVFLGQFYHNIDDTMG